LLLRESNILVCLVEATLCAITDSKPADVHEVGNICLDFTGLDLSVFESRKSLMGMLIYKLEYDVKVVFGAQEGILKFEAVSKGKVIGKTSINFHNPSFY
jgi:hypothetical protein